MANPIPVVDLFAGPGGLGEGFSSLADGNSFRIIVSAEMETSAHETLRLRAFFRILKRKGESFLNDYYRFCNGESETPYSDQTIDEWLEAEKEAQKLTLGEPKDNHRLIETIKKAKLGLSVPWVLIGGPPCQAYSLAGRVRNLGKADYVPESDERHYLYREYLKIIQQFKPSVFVMENVKGILSSQIKGKKIFHSILRDLSNPDKALGKSTHSGYRIYSLTAETMFTREMRPEDINVNEYIIRAEDYGIPQARHRVILIGVREDIFAKPSHLEKTDPKSVIESIQDLPQIRSRLSKEPDNNESWYEAVSTHLKELYKEASDREDLKELASYFNLLSKKLIKNSSFGGLRISKSIISTANKSELSDWYSDKNLKFWLNHESRGHMSSDLRRYIYASSYAEVYGVSPKGHEKFDLSGLKPNHKNWESGNFSDRFRVQVKNFPATTITSHISKDGHYFIHPDPSQCRSLTVREAARLQTFPDNYFFQGNRTQQFHQVGNAVPPLLALKIAEIVKSIIS